jgi:hypothetical protein
MNIKAALVSFLGVGLASMTVSLLAHHGDAGRYEDKLTTVKGTVVELQLINPHSIVVLDVPSDDGKVVRWRGEAGSATQLKGWCWNKDVIKIGDSVTMIGRRLKNGSPYMTLSENARVIDANGKEIYKGNDPGQPNEPGPCAPARTGGQ